VSNQIVLSDPAGHYELLTLQSLSSRFYPRALLAFLLVGQSLAAAAISCPSDVASQAAVSRTVTLGATPCAEKSAHSPEKSAHSPEKSTHSPGQNAHSAKEKPHHDPAAELQRAAADSCCEGGYCSQGGCAPLCLTVQGRAGVAYGSAVIETAPLALRALSPNPENPFRPPSL